MLSFFRWGEKRSGWIPYAVLLTALGCGPRERPGEPTLLGRQEQALGSGATLPSQRYPIALAPQAWAETQKVVGSETTSWDAFGASVSLDQNEALIGSTSDETGGVEQGAAYVFLRSARQWGESQKLVADDGELGDQFGGAVALSGNYALIGAPRDDDGGSNAGAVYVFTRSATSWSQSQKLSASDGLANAWFGAAVALSGDTAIIGAPRDAADGNSAGGAYIFLRSAQSYGESLRIRGSRVNSYDEFGTSVAIDGDDALIGAPEDGYFDSAAGAVYAFHRSALSWTQNAELRPAGSADHDRFGIAVALDGSRAIVGADNYLDSAFEAGYAQFFERGATGWTVGTKLWASDTASNDAFGRAVSLSGASALVGARGNGGAGNAAGASYVMARSATTWIEAQKLVASDAAASSWFGHAVALGGDTALVGASSSASAKGAFSGEAYFFQLGTVAGEACSAAIECQSGHCVDGTCCDSACADGCGGCSLAGSEGICTPVSKGMAPTSKCDGYRCSGASTNCPSSCSGDADCRDGHHCQQATACVPKALDGQACNAASACRSGHCIGGVCCDQACDGGCGTCLADDARGSCTPLQPGDSGTPSCSPFLCDGIAADCPESCTVHEDCKLGFHCAEGTCLSDGAPGEGCETHGECASGHCTDAVCCHSASCAPYLCGSGGTCKLACTSSAQCAQGHSCRSDGKCERVASQTGSPAESGGCSMLAAKRQPLPPAGWLSTLGIAMGIARRRRQRNLPRRGVRAARGHCAQRFRLASLLAFMGLGCHPSDTTKLEADTSPTPPEIAKPSADPADNSMTDTRSHLSADPGQPDGAPLVSEDLAPGGPSNAYPLSPAPPSWGETQKLTASDAAAKHDFGQSMVMAAQEAFIGAPGHDHSGADAGASYFFTRSAHAWNERQRLVAQSAAAGDGFGFSISFDGNTALIGARRRDGSASDTGSAFIFVRSGESWTQSQELVASDAAAGDEFGYAVALRGDRALIGAPGCNDAGLDAGATYAFGRSANSWSEVEKLQAGDAAADQAFGNAVLLSATSAFVGSRGQVTSSVVGSAYVFDRSASAWAERQKLVASDGTAGNRFGTSLAQSGDRLLIGAYLQKVLGSSTGRVYAFSRTALDWTEAQRVLSLDAGNNNSFGVNVGLDQDVALIGAYGKSDAGLFSGAAYVFGRAASSWAQARKLTASDAASMNFYGGTVALSGSTGLVGASGESGAGDSSGAVYAIALGLLAGDGCSTDSECLSTHCVDQVCCEAACGAPCASCNQDSFEGTCLPKALGDAPSNACSGHLCDGEQSSCASSCSGDADCGADHFCDNAINCVPKADKGTLCSRDGGCASGHCVEGLCCDRACDEGCGSCTDGAAPGVCSHLERGHSGAPNCAPYVCDGQASNCPSACNVDGDCMRGHHCSGGSCQQDAALGGSCDDENGCASGLCTDGVCCDAPSCEPYRCGVAGVCELACTSSAQCSDGYSCSSGGKCMRDAPRSESESGGCALIRTRPLRHSDGGAWLILGALLGLHRRRKRRDKN